MLKISVFLFSLIIGMQIAIFLYLFEIKKEQAELRREINDEKARAADASIHMRFLDSDIERIHTVDEQLRGQIDWLRFVTPEKM